MRTRWWTSKYSRLKSNWELPKDAISLHYIMGIITKLRIEMWQTKRTKYVNTTLENWLSICYADAEFLRYLLNPIIY